MKRILVIIVFFTLALINSEVYSQGGSKPWNNGKLIPHTNKQYLVHENGKPFFWLGDTGWNLALRATREEVRHYLDVRRDQGYNVIQMMLMWDFPAVNIYGEPSFMNTSQIKDLSKQTGRYGFWDHVDFIVEEASKRGIYVALLPTWGLVVNKGSFSRETARDYAIFLAMRYKDKPNIIWVNGGDVDAAVKLEIWQTIGETLKEYDSNHLITFHPRGSRTTTAWFAETSWIDFHMFQSGHRRSGQNRAKGVNAEYTGNYQEEDNWRFVEEGYQLINQKPILDGEPAYEDIIHGLADINQPRFKAEDVRRFAYWSVFAGACGHTYGNNAVMLMYKPGFPVQYGNTRNWYDAIHDAGGAQMKYLKELMLKFPYFDRVPDQSIIVGENGDRYDRLIATRGKDYLLVYGFMGQMMKVDLGKISGKTKEVWWMQPSTGKYIYIGEFKDGIHEFYPQNGTLYGNDWVLIAVDNALETDLKK